MTRAYVWLGALGLALGVAGSAHAQRTLLFPSNSFPRSYKPFMTEDPNKPIATPQYLPSRTSTSLLSFFPSFSPISAKPVHGTTSYPTPNQLPGVGYLSIFRPRSPGYLTPNTFGW